MLWRVLLKYPLGNTASIMPAAIVNLLGESGHSGEANYEGLDEVLRMDNTFVHLYGKKETRGGRKMGHVTILGKDRADLIHKAHRIKKTLRITTKSAVV
jgi:5-(carboxyamino)imidazole ribonucleotide synthase